MTVDVRDWLEPAFRADLMIGSPGEEGSRSLSPGTEHDPAPVIGCDAIGARTRVTDPNRPATGHDA